MSQRIILELAYNGIGKEVQLGCVSMYLLLLRKMTLSIEESTLYTILNS